MKVLFTGSGSSGSWQIRGVQLGRALGATVEPKAINVAGFDVAVVVKRPPADLVARIHAAGVPLVWDVVDAWPQPQGNGWNKAECMAWLTQQVAAIKPAGIVAATKQMAADCAGFGVPVLVLPHHARPGITVNPLRRDVRTVGYEGGDYLGPCRQVLDAECARRGWRFVGNPERLADLDIVVALRAAEGYAPRHWKSNVKLANAQGSGTPFIGGMEWGYLEHAIGVEKFVRTPAELAAALDALTSQDARCFAGRLLHAAAPTLTQMADRYEPWLAALAWNTAPSC